ncbi:ATP-binding protein, partial [Staphylococcus epidermidis]
LPPYNHNQNIDFLPQAPLALFLIHSLIHQVTLYKESPVTISIINYIKKHHLPNNRQTLQITYSTITSTN